LTPFLSMWCEVEGESTWNPRMPPHFDALLST
jgi:hypothetical protein